MLPRPRPSLRCQSVICSERSLVAWILVAGTLFVAAVTLQLVSTMTKSFPFTRTRAGDYWVKSDLHNDSCQWQPNLRNSPNVSLDVSTKIYVISLPRRTDRRFQMDRLKDALNLRWTYKDACEANTTLVASILRQVHVLRSQWMSEPQTEDGHMPPDSKVSPFDWPHHLEDAICSRETLQPSGSELWTLHSLHSPTDLTAPVETVGPYALAHPPSGEPARVSDFTPLACASGNNVLATFSPDLPLYKRLTAAKVACWYSHFQTIHEIADGKDETALVLEDDIDIERDVKGRLQPLMGALPIDWDIVYLGHCWSDEARFPPLRNVSLQLPSGRTTLSGLHPANSPKCTHAYVLSRIGARRIVAHLRHPPFAYSRAIDQGLAWLVESGRLRAFSIVPPVVVQRKISVSDVMPGLGSAWRDGLYDGVLAGVHE